MDIEEEAKSKNRYAKNKRQLGMIPEEGFMRLAQVLSVFPVSQGTWYNGIATGIYPAPVKLGTRSTAWKVEDIRALIEKLGQS